MNSKIRQSTIDNRHSKHEVKKTAFTLIETILVMVILAIAMSGAMYVLSSVLFATEKNQHRLTAVYLAQECAELVRNLRDTAWKKKLPWDCAFQSSTLNQPNIIAPDHNGSASSICGHNFGLELKLNVTPESQKLFQHGSLINHTPSDRELMFKRNFQLTQHSDEEISFNCNVTWKFRNQEENLTISSILTNWQKN